MQSLARISQDALRCSQANVSHTKVCVPVTTRNSFSSFGNSILFLQNGGGYNQQGDDRAWLVAVLFSSFGKTPEGVTTGTRKR